MLSERYQNEQAELDTKITELKAKTEETVQTEKNVGLWVDLIGKYADATELTAPMLNDLIDKIAVHEAKKDENGGRGSTHDMVARGFMQPTPYFFVKLNI